jgi:hypothetical protein
MILSCTSAFLHVRVPSSSFLRFLISGISQNPWLLSDEATKRLNCSFLVFRFIYWEVRIYGEVSRIDLLVLKVIGSGSS